MLLALLLSLILAPPRVAAEGTVLAAGPGGPGFLIDALQDVLCRLLRAVAMDRDARAAPGGPDRDLGADAAAAAGDEHDPAGEVGVHPRSPAVASAARIVAVVDSSTGWSGGRMTVQSMTPSSRRETFVRAR